MNLIRRVGHMKVRHMSFITAAMVGLFVRCAGRRDTKERDFHWSIYVVAIGVLSVLWL